MSAKRSRKTEKKGDDSTKMAKVQIQRLGRQYKVMEGSRITYEEEMNMQLAKQRAQLQHMLDQKERIGTADVVSKSNRIKLKEETNNILSLLDKKKILQKQVKLARMDLNETKIQLFKADNELLLLRTKRMSGFKNSSELINELLKRMHLLESKLNIAHIEMNKVMTKNTGYREEIQHHLKERYRFKELLENRVHMLNEGKKTVLDMIEQATIAFEHREEAQAKLDSLNEKNISLKELHTQQMRDLDRLLYTDTERVEFLTIKVQAREAEDSQAKKEARGKKQELTNLTNTYNRIMEEITEFVSSDDLEVICETFKSGEDENFAVFNYVNEVNCEAESLNDAARAVRQKIDKEKALKVERVAQQADDVKALDDELSAVQSEIADLQDANRTIHVGLTMVTGSLKDITDSALCSSSPFFYLVEDKEQVTLGNVHLFLMVLEKQIKRILESLQPKREETPPKTPSRLSFLPSKRH
ncbi:Coiled-coil domain containing [Nesidiocoris tenuis]|uniref:Coiled-coil domain containing n=1 Tax=Nesidiocoris tenuis TaxID=355587 RepID=A0ABN7AXN9_9HEMI|nr:Coiled-coil domain containing [Nesidiocoris tenuis]